MKTNPTRYSSAVGEVWIMMTLKLRYCHNMFDNRAIREYTDAMLAEAMAFYQIRWKKKSFDNNHVHIIVEMGIKKKAQFAKLLRLCHIAPLYPYCLRYTNRLFRSKG